MRRGLIEEPPVVELRVMPQFPCHGWCGQCHYSFEAGDEYLYDHGHLICEECLDVDYPVMTEEEEELEEELL